MIAYKFIESEFAASAAKGRIKLTLHSVFNGTEQEEIRDEHDGRSVGHIDHAVITDGNLASTILKDRLVRHHFMNLPDHVEQVIFENTTFSWLPAHAYILSLSSDRRCKKWLNQTKPKDAVVTVQGARILGLEIAKRYSDILLQPRFGYVKYTQNTTDLTREDLEPPDPFLKRSFFQTECEYRLVFPAKGTPKCDWFITDCPEVTSILSWKMRTS